MFFQKIVSIFRLARLLKEKDKKSNTILEYFSRIINVLVNIKKFVNFLDSFIQKFITINFCIKESKKLTNKLFLTST
jgi:hypothetical protein